MAPPGNSKNQKAPTRRAAGRVDWTPESDLEVFLVPRSGDAVKLSWADISVSGTQVEVPAEFAEEVKEGAPIRLRFGVDGLNFRVNGRVIWCHAPEECGTMNVGVHFAYLDPTIAEGHPELWVYFNRRKAFRVSPPINEELPVQVVGPDGQTSTVRLVDISATGISITLPEECPISNWVEQGLGHKYELHLTLLPEEGEIKIITRAERVFKAGKDQCWGMSILEEDERHLGNALETIEEYIMVRQRQMRGGEE